MCPNIHADIEGNSARLARLEGRILLGGEEILRILGKFCGDLYTELLHSPEAKLEEFQIFCLHMLGDWLIYPPAKKIASAICPCSIILVGNQ